MRLTRRHGRIGFALGCLLSFVGASSAASQSVLRWGGEWQMTGGVAGYESTYEFDLGAQLRLNARTNTFPWRVFADGRLWADGLPPAAEEWEVDGELDRLYLHVYMPVADVILGKQAINWGIGSAWRPTDIFAPATPAVAGDSIRPGVEAAVVQIPSGPLGYWSLALTKDVYGVRRKGYASGADWSVLAADDAGARLIGADLKFDWGPGWYGAVVGRFPEQGDERTIEGVVGADYSWLQGDLTWLGEIPFRGGAGTGASQPRMTFQQLAYRVDDFTSVFGTVLADPSDGSATWTAGVDTALGGQTRLALRGTLSTMPGPATTATLPRTALRLQVSGAF